MITPILIPMSRPRPCPCGGKCPCHYGPEILFPLALLAALAAAVLVGYHQWQTDFLGFTWVHYGETAIRTSDRVMGAAMGAVIGAVGVGIVCLIASALWWAVKNVVLSVVGLFRRD